LAANVVQLHDICNDMDHLHIFKFAHFQIVLCSLKDWENKKQSSNDEVRYNREDQRHN